MTMSSVWRSTCLSLALLASLIVCGSKRPAAQTQPSREESRAALQSEIDELRNRVDSLDEGLARQVESLSARADLPWKIEVDATAAGPYQQVFTSAGWFLLSVHDARPYLNGFRVSLDIGNPSFVTYDGVKLKVSWGAKSEKDLTTFEVFERLSEGLPPIRKDKEIDLTNVLDPGKWNRVTVDLLPSTVEELKYLGISIEPNTISLNR